MSGQAKSIAVVFDMDDTLYGERDYVRSGYAAVARHLVGKLGKGRIEGEARGIETWLWRRFTSGVEGLAFDALSEEFALRLSRAEILDMVRTYREHRPEIAPYPGVTAMLERLRGACRLGLLSDGFLPAQQYKLDALGIERLFDVVVFTEELGRDKWKPSPVGFEVIRDRLEVSDDACTYVGDNVAKDFVAPNSLGWRTIHYVRAGQVHVGKTAPPGGEPKLVVRSDDELWCALMD